MHSCLIKTVTNRLTSLSIINHIAIEYHDLFNHDRAIRVLINVREKFEIRSGKKMTLGNLCVPDTSLASSNVFKYQKVRRSQSS